MTAVVFTAGQPASAAALNEVANAADAASTAAAGMADSATAAALSAQHASDQAVVATTAATNTTSFATAAASNAAAAAASATAAGVSAVGASGAFNIGRNYIDNPMFSVSQRSAGPWTTPSYTADRWRIFSIHSSGGSISVTLPGLGDAERTAIGDEEAEVCLRAVFTGGSAATDLDVIAQRIENAHRLGGRTVTVSFWAKAASGAPKVGVSIDQNSGTGGSPSSDATPDGAAVSITTSWARYSVTTTVISTIGKVLGTNADSNTQLNLWLSSGSANNTRSGALGVQSNTISFWGIQVEVGNVATPLEKRSQQMELARCQRFYQTGVYTFIAYGGANGNIATVYPYPVAMRAGPVVTISPTITINCTQNILTDGPLNFVVSASVTALGQAQLSGTFFATAEL